MRSTQAGEHPYLRGAERHSRQPAPCRLEPRPRRPGGCSCPASPAQDENAAVLLVVDSDCTTVSAPSGSGAPVMMLGRLARTQPMGCHMTRGDGLRDEQPSPENPRSPRRCPRPHGEPVHAGVVERGNVVRGDDVFGQHRAESLGECVVSSGSAAASARTRARASSMLISLAGMDHPSGTAAVRRIARGPMRFATRRSEHRIHAPQENGSHACRSPYAGAWWTASDN